MGAACGLAADNPMGMRLCCWSCTRESEGPFDLSVETLDVTTGDGSRPEAVGVVVSLGADTVSAAGKLQDGKYRWTYDRTCPSLRVSSVLSDALEVRLEGAAKPVRGLRLVRMGLVVGGAVPVDVAVEGHIVRLLLGLHEPHPLRHTPFGPPAPLQDQATALRKGDRSSTAAESSLGPASEGWTLAPNGSPLEPWPRSNWEKADPRHRLDTMA
eukprot:GGOE01061285.1.p2 GENE.GGOE01061285.1~~GGOE01061285.1.p2  ORF type:complete len:235 (-),score=51.58 GGOE01061285.1:300-938(-)